MENPLNDELNLLADLYQSHLLKIEIRTTKIFNKLNQSNLIQSIDQTYAEIEDIINTSKKFGYIELNKQTLVLKEEFKLSSPSVDNLKFYIVKLQEIIKMNITRTEAQSKTKQPVKSHLPSVYVLDKENIFFSQLNNHIDSHLVVLINFHNFDVLYEQLQQEEANLVIINDRIQEEQIIKIKQFKNQNSQHMKLLLVSEFDSFQSRINSILKGSDYFFARPVCLEKLEMLIYDVISLSFSGHHKILLIDSDAELIECEKTIQNFGYETLKVKQPFEIISTIEKFDPELIIIDEKTSFFSSMNLSNIIRQEYTYNNIPIMVMIDEANHKNEIPQIDVYNTENFISKPIQKEIFLKKIKERTQHAKRHKFISNRWQKEINKSKEIELQTRETSNQKDSFLANMSHEIRTPLNGILATIQLLEMKELDQESKELLRLQKTSSQILQTIINDILDFSKIESGKINLEDTIISFDQIIHDLMEMFANFAKEKDILLALSKDPKVPKFLRADEIRLKQIITNLMSNAIKFTKQGGVHLKIDLLYKSDKYATIKISVIDTGIGLSNEQQTKLFKPFIQADSSTTRKFGGTGLGLSICKQLVTLMGGDICIKSNINEGCNFYFTIEYPIYDPTPTCNHFLNQNKIKISIITQEKTVFKIFSDGLLKYNFEMNHIATLDDFISEMPHVKDSDIFIFDNSYSELLCQNISPLLKKSNKTFKLVNGIMETTPLVSETRYLDFYNFILKINDIKYPRTVISHNNMNTNVLLNFNGLKILLAEDNSVNQKLAQKIFEKLSCTVIIAENGLQAFELCRNNQFDVIFMDCQMPILDGYDATLKIRSELDKNIPIFAMTAHAFQKEINRCFEVGMNEYIAKPIEIKRLESVLSKYFPKNIVHSHKQSIEEKSCQGIINDLVDNQRFIQLKEAVDGEIEFLLELLKDFNNNIPRLIEDLLKAINEKDVKNVEFIAHRIKGSSGNLALMKLAHLASEIEKSCKENLDLSSMEQNAKEIKKIYLPSIKQLKNFIEDAERAA